MKKSLLLFLLVLLSGTGWAQTTLLAESFETDGEGSRYVSTTFDFRPNTNPPPSPNNNGLTQYFVRNTANPVLNPYPSGGSSFGSNAAPITIGSVTGSAFWISEGVRGTGDASTIIRPAATLTVNPVSTTGYSGLQVRVDFAQGTRAGIPQIENDDKINIQYSTDGVNYNTIGRFVGDNPAANVAGNWRQDVNLDGSSVDDATLGSPILSQTLTIFTFNIPVTASTIRVRIEVDQVGGTEELAFDNIRLLGTVSATAAPVLANIETSVLPYAEGQAATQVTNAITVSDADSPTLVGATVQFLSGFVAGQDVLDFTAGNGISKSYNASTGVLTLSGTATLANYQAALRTVTYQNTNIVTAAGGNRLLQFTVNDGANSSNGATRTVVVTAVLNAAAALPFTEDFTTNGEGLRYSSNQFTSSGNAAFLRTNSNPYDASGNPTTFTNISNGFYWFGENTSTGNNPDPLRIGRLVTQQVDANGFSGLHFQIRLGATSVGSRIQTSDYFRLYYRTGGSTGTWTLFGSFRGSNSAATGNGVMQQDTDPNNPGTVPTGTTLTEALQNFDFALPAAANGQQVDFRLDLSIDDDPADFAFDLIQVTGTLTPPVVTAPANGSLLNTRTPTYSGTAAAGSTVTVFVDGTSIGTTTATAGGTFSLNQSTNLADGSHNVRATATLSGVTSASSNTNTFTVDATAPTVTISSTAGASGGNTGTSPIPFTVTFSESVTGFASSDVTVTNGTLSGFTGSGATYTFSVTPTANGAVTVSVPANVAQDAAGNGNVAASTFSITYTQPVTAAPVVTTPANGSLLNNATPTYTGTAPANSTVTVYVDGVSIGTTTATAGGSFSLSQPTALAQGSHTVRATAQSSGAAVSANSNTNTFTIDTVRPTVSISSTATNPTNTSPIPVTVTFSESVTGFLASSVAVTNGALSGFSGSGASYTFNITPTAAGAVTVNIPANAATDAAGNGNTAATQFSITYALPITATPTVTTPANGSLLSTRTPTYSGTAPANSTVTLYVDGASIGTTTATAGGTFSLSQPTNLADGSHTVYATAQSSGAAVSANSNTNTFTIDATAPTVAINSTATSPTSTSPIPVTVTFSESVTGFVASDVTVTNGTLSGFSGSGNSYSFTVTPTVGGTVTVNIAANVAQDAAGNGNTAAVQFSIVYTAPVSVTVWTGLVSTDWFTPGNWSAGVPSSTLDAQVPVVGNSNYPSIGAGTATVRGLTVNAGATLNQTGGTLDVRANIINNGIFLPTGGTVVLGTTFQSNGPNILGSSIIRFWNLTVNSNGVLLSTSAGASVQRLLTLNGAFVTQGNAFTLESNSVGTALVVNNSGGFVFGTATVQRYIDPSLNGGLGYRHYSSPVVSTAVADLATSTFTPVVNPTYNTVGNTATPFPTVYGYDESRITSTNATTQSFDQGYFSPSTTGDVLTPGRGYTVNIDAASKVDLVGALNNGTVAVGALSRGSEANSGWHLLGNPYPAPLDWNVARTGLPTGVIDAVYVFKSSSQYAGTYQFYQNGFGTLPGGLIGSMQGFFVRVSQPVAAFSFLNAWRSTSYQNPTFNRTTSDTRPAVQLELVSAQGTHDAAFVYFEQGATAGLDDHYDAVKLPNTTGLNLASVAASNNLAVNGLPLMGTAPVTVPLFIGLPATGTYTLHAAQLLNFAPGAQPWLRDLQLNTLTDLSLTPDYAFTMNATNTTPRFELVFGPAQVLSTSAALAAQVAVFPNPARSAVAVELPGSLSRQPVTAALVDALGRVVAQQVLPAGLSTHKLPLTNVATGVYTLRLSTPAGVIVKKLIVE